MCVCFVVPKPDIPHGDWRDPMWSEVSGDNYVVTRFLAKVYGLNQLPEYTDITDGSEAGVLLTDNCHRAMDAAEELHGEAGIELMVRVGYNMYAPLNDHTTQRNDHGRFMPCEGKKRVVYNFLYEEEWDFWRELCLAMAVPSSQELRWVHSVQGGAFMEEIAPMQGQYMLLGYVDNEKEVQKDISRLVRFIKTTQPIAFVEL